MFGCLYSQETIYKKECQSAYCKYFLYSIEAFQQDRRIGFVSYVKNPVRTLRITCLSVEEGCSDKDLKFKLFIKALNDSRVSGIDYIQFRIEEKDSMDCLIHFGKDFGARQYNDNSSEIIFDSAPFMRLQGERKVLTLKQSAFIAALLR